MGGVPNASGPSPTLGSLGSSHQWRHKSRVSLRGPPCAHGVASTPQGEVRDKEPEMVANLTWVGFKELLVERFTPEYQELREGMNLVQMRHTGSLKAYVRDFNAQMNATPKMDEFAKKCIFLGGLQKWVVDALFKFPKLPETWQGSSRLQRELKQTALRGSQVALLNKVALARMGSQGKERKKFGSSNPHKGQVDGTTYNKGGNHVSKPPKVSRTSPSGVPATPWAQGGPRSDARDLWCHS